MSHARRTLCALLLALCSLSVGSLPSTMAASCSVNGVSYTVTKSGAGTIAGTSGNDVILGSAGR
ncbi:MAG TPA: hypothetical protein PK819_10405, partial [Thermomicrobiales bacterium]|nr:hypothetical protein [Thermomicrobiales bacterium]